jgi:hypothetical protein
MTISFTAFDMYSKRIGLFYQKKEKIGTLLGFILTMIYICVSLFLFILYITEIINRKNINVHDSTIYPKEPPSIHIDNNLFYFAFGVETHSGTTRFIDPTIYYPRVHFYDKIKEGGSLKTIYEEELKVERCDDTKFGNDYKNLLVKGELNNSYCLDNINVTLKGGFKYDRISYIRLSIYPCVNSTDNNNHCKPQEIIDAHLSGAYFSILAKNKGLDPSNYSNPIIPTFQDLYTTLDKSFFRDYIIYFGITDIQTDEGLFNEQIHSRKILQFRKESQTFYHRSEQKYYNGSTMCAIQFRLGDDIRVQKRSYNKITEVLATTGGYMQLISTVFTITTILANKLMYEVKIANSLFNFYPTKRKISVKSEFTKLIDCLNNKNKDNSLLFKNSNNNSSNINNKEIGRNFNNKTMFNSSNRNRNNSFMINHQRNNNSFNPNIDPNNLNVFINSSKILKLNNYSINYSRNDESKSGFFSKNEDSKLNHNRSRIALLPYGIDLVSSNNNQFNSIKPKRNPNLRQSDYLFAKKHTVNDYGAKSMQINLFYYYCFSNCKKDKEDIKLFELGISFYRKKMDIIHIFNILLLIEKIVSNHE